jgi:hypothetical protein
MGYLLASSSQGNLQSFLGLSDETKASVWNDSFQHKTGINDQTTRGFITRQSFHIIYLDVSIHSSGFAWATPHPPISSLHIEIGFCKEIWR